MQVAERANSLSLPCFIVSKYNIAYTVAHIKNIFDGNINEIMHIHGAVYMHYANIDI